MSSTTIFKVTSPGDEPPRFVEAPSRVAAFMHVAGDYFKVEPVDKRGLIDVAKSGKPIEVAEVKTKAKAEEKKDAA